MSLDGIAMAALTKEMSEKLTEGRIDKISQPNNQTLTFQVRVDGQNKKILASINPQNTRLVITKETFDNPQQPPLFCMVLRKHLQNALISEVEQIERERMIRFTCLGRNEIGEPTKVFLLFELMGKNSNIILLNEENTILSAMRLVGAHTNAYRQIQPGLDYVMPPAQNKQNIETLTEEGLIEHLLEQPNTRTVKKALMNILAGFGPQSIAELLERSHIEADTRLEFLGQIDYQNIFSNLQQLVQTIQTGNWQPTLIRHHGVPVAFAPFELHQFEMEKHESYDSMSELLEAYFTDKERNERFEQKKNALERILRHEKERCEKKYAIQLETIEKVDTVEIYRIYGELLTANLYQIKQGKEATVLNFYDENKPIVIEMNPELTPNDNAQKYFKIYNRAKKGAEKATLQAEITAQELDYIASISEGLENAKTFEDIAEIRKEMAASEYVKAQPQKRKKKVENTPKPLILETEGYTLYIGKNNIQNDYVTLKIGRNKDMWLHTKDIHGAHVIIKAPHDGEFSDAILEIAAEIAAYYSKGRQSNQVPVDYTLRKYVHKPSGAKPGMVIYTDQTTVYVKPNDHGTDKESL